MALNINGRIKVKTLRADFKKEFGLVLRVYNGRSFADDDATLASIRKGDSKGGEFAPKRNTKVGNLEDKIMDMFGIKTQVAGSDDSYLCKNEYTLAKALEADEKLMIKRSKRTNIVSKEDVKSSKPETIEEDEDVSIEDYQYIIATLSRDRKDIDFIKVAVFLRRIDHYLDDGYTAYHAYIVGYTGDGMQEGRWYSFDDDKSIVKMSVDGQTWDAVYDIEEDSTIGEMVMVTPEISEIYLSLTDESKEFLEEIDDLEFHIKENYFNDMIAFKEQDQLELQWCDFEDIELLLNKISNEPAVWPFLIQWEEKDDDFDDFEDDDFDDTDDDI